MSKHVGVIFLVIAVTTILAHASETEESTKCRVEFISKLYNLCQLDGQNNVDKKDERFIGGASGFWKKRRSFDNKYKFWKKKDSIAERNSADLNDWLSACLIGFMRTERLKPVAQGNRAERGLSGGACGAGSEEHILALSQIAEDKTSPVYITAEYCCENGCILKEG